MIFLILLILAVLIVLGFPIAVSLGLAVLVFLVQGNVPLSIVPLMMFTGMENFVFLAMPLFMLAGELMNRAGIAEDLIDLASSLVGAMRGGLAMVNIAASMIFAEISGSAVADVAAQGVILIPQMEKRGYPRAFAAAITSSSASIAIIIPPSLGLILYGAIANVSVVKLFIAGVLPGILIGVLLMAFSWVFAVRNGWPPEARFQFRRLWKSLRKAIWALSMPVIILGGIFTPTEAAAVAVAAALLIGLVINQRITLADLPNLILVSVKRTSIVLLMVATSAVFGWHLSNEGIPQAIAGRVMTLSDNRYVLMFLVNLLLIVLHMFLHGSASIVLTVPIALPLAEQLGYDPIHFGLIMVMNGAIGQQTPPVASVLMTASAISGSSIAEIMHYNKWFILALFIALQIVTYIPAVSLWLPSLIGQ
jgi:tripartite ATP-independent transporter DctM subunit